MAGPPSPTFADMPREIKQEIIKELDPLDLAAVSKTSRDLHDAIADDWVLYKTVYTRILDEPVEPFIPQSWDWMTQLAKFVRLRFALGQSPRSRTLQEKVQRFSSVYPIISDLMYTASPSPESLNTRLLHQHFTSKTNQEAYLCRSTLFSRATSPPHIHPPTTPSEAQASAKLHVLYGVPISSPSRTHYKPSYPYAVSIVYDLRRYTEETFWGPYMGDGQASVDWEKMEAVMCVLGHNLNLFVERTRNSFRDVWRDPWLGASPGSFKPISVSGLKEPAPPAEALDPYNVTGSWMRVVCFLDFHDLFAYNFSLTSLPATSPRPPLDISEAIRLIIMELRITSITPDPDHTTGGTSWPIVHFTGVSRSMHTSFDANANSNIRGTVRMTREGECRWTTFSVYSGQERWKSEGIQVGGPNSSRGVFGHWFDKDHDPHGPAGPTAFWKVSNEIDERKEDYHMDTGDSDDENGDYYEEDDDEEEEGEGEVDEETAQHVVGMVVGALVVGGMLEVD